MFKRDDEPVRNAWRCGAEQAPPEHVRAVANSEKGGLDRLVADLTGRLERLLHPERRPAQN